ncbi:MULTISPECIES: bifunctional hydroxymethylpyrimidine kinase/phosphomethylpyrimidine kinase [Rhodovulum]|uniref:hydroxymethylpyrimidine kinase n=2 Tax=Rhodovulum TaxID=34008 RepID=A0A844BAS1_9RHOB|nr:MULTISPECIES: bifunctional hydroxymethylpyrimidine kinase/phosphomethylpyrimidine kinase [Rhodovulum]MRH19758.1 bifunctional hydroxymethylpyrimidine kinase/phosphomethylpyrimidine kinase [Rhodovulum strictum]TCM83539.1 hydroxymethylpyrimidine kinase /phosphomethylpyrimidine kinase [Rhodovulum steppense]
MIPNILSIAGSDPSGGAGIQADLKSIGANGGYGMAAITALTVQNTQGVRAAELVAPEFVAAQVQAVFDDIRVDAVKIGMLGSAAIVQAVAGVLDGRDVPVVLDPVMVAKGGDRLLAADAVAALRDLLLPMARVITPNLPEAADLLDRPEARTREEMEAQAEALLALGCGAVFLKGGHLGDEESPDLFLSPGRRVWLIAPRVATRNTHGTGCTLSAALATHLAALADPLAAASAAKDYTLAAIRAADGLWVGRGTGPTDHFHALRR